VIFSNKNYFTRFKSFFVITARNHAGQVKGDVPKAKATKESLVQAGKKNQFSCNEKTERAVGNEDFSSANGVQKSCFCNRCKTTFCTPYCGLMLASSE
jgi:hypothetical protein